MYKNLQKPEAGEAHTSTEKARGGAYRSMITQAAMLCLILVIMGNLNAVVDYFLHPDIPYFDEEHLLVGGTTMLMSAFLFGLLMVYVRYLNKALTTITALEEMLAICAYCRRIRVPDADPAEMESWQPLEEYVAKRMTRQFSHGMCPECAAREFPDYQ